jgi:hypothetical protein
MDIDGIKYINGTASGIILSTPGTFYGFIVNSHSGGTLRFNDGTSTTTSAGTKASSVLTITGAISNNETVTVGGKTYTFKTTLSSPAVAYEVLLGVSDATALDNLKSAINGTAGEGTTYGTGTLANPKVTATTNTDTQQTVEAIYVGTYANTYATSETMANGSWTGATLSGGVEPSLLVVNTFTPPTGSSTYHFPMGIDVYNGLYVTKGGTIDYTILYKEN